MRDNKISILDLVIILLERKWFLLVSLLLIGAVSVVYTLFLPKYYTAQGLLLPSSSSSMSNPLAAMLGDLPVGNMMKSLDFLDGGSDNDQVLAILGSRRLAEKIITQFDLANRYEFTKKKKFFFENLLIAFNRNYSVAETDLKNISITFTDSNPTFAAEVANAIITHLDSISSEISHNSAKNTRIFFENRLSVVKKEMDATHQQLAKFQEKYNYIDLEQQIKSSISALSAVEAQILNTDIKMEFLKNRFGNSNFEATELLKDRKVLEKRMQHYLDSGSGELIIPLKKTPQLAIEYSYHLRDVKVQEILYGFIMQNYEQAKLTEAKNTPTVNVLEYASVPQKKSRPKRMIICLILCSIGFIGIIAIIFITKWYTIQRSEQTASYQKIATVISHLKLR